MGLTKKAMSIVYKFIEETRNKAFGSLISEKMKGGITYKVYFELIGDNKYSEKPAYIKLVFPSDEEVIISPLGEMEKAFKKGRQAEMIRYEFEKKPKNMPRYVYIFRIGEKFFDLPEELAKNISKELGIQIQKNNPKSF